MLSPRFGVLLAAFCLLVAFLGDALTPPARAEAFIFKSKPQDPDVVDTTGPAEPVLQKPEEGLAGYPLDRKGNVDWVLALNNKTIAPRTSVKQMVLEEMKILDKDIVMKNTKGMPYVKFPHKTHTQLLACTNCHDEIFAQKAGSSQINMRKIFMGEYCGVCHGKVAFTAANYCERCHSIPFGKTKAWW